MMATCSWAHTGLLRWTPGPRAPLRCSKASYVRMDMEMADGHDHTPEIFAVEFSTDRPLHAVAAEKRRVAAAGAGMRAVNEFAYAAAVALDPTLLVVSFIKQSRSAKVADLLDVLPGVLSHVQDVTKRHTSTLVRLATAAGQLTGGEVALRSGGDYEAAAAVVAAQLSAADAFFVEMIEATDPGRRPSEGPRLRAASPRPREGRAAVAAAQLQGPQAGDASCRDGARIGCDRVERGRLTPNVDVSPQGWFRVPHALAVLGAGRGRTPRAVELAAWMAVCAGNLWWTASRFEDGPDPASGPGCVDSPADRGQHGVGEPSVGCRHRR